MCKYCIGQLIIVRCGPPIKLKKLYTSYKLSRETNLSRILNSEKKYPKNFGRLKPKPTDCVHGSVKKERVERNL